MYQHIHEDVLPSQKYLIDAVIDPSVDPIAKAWGVPIWEFFQQVSPHWSSSIGTTF
jgi:hypothetical protein